MFRGVKISVKLLLIILVIALGAVTLVYAISYRELSALSSESLNHTDEISKIATGEIDATLKSLGDEWNVPANEIEYATNRARDIVETYSDRARAEQSNMLSETRLRFSILITACALVVCYVAWLLIRAITQPLNKLLLGVRRIGGGDLSGKVEVEGRDEIGELGKAFNAMTDDLQEYISNFTAAEAEKERLDGELSIAAGIQNDMLPDVRARFGGETRVNMFASMVAAKEVGGDFYDLFYIDDKCTKLCAIIADVSGKSVPAALFMVVAKTLIKTCFLQSDSPADALMKANNILAEDNASSMFVTTFAAVLDIPTGVITFANAGHNPPLISKNGVFEYMKVRRSLPLAAMAGIKYRNEQISIDPGEALFLYTDGVTEAMSEHNDLFGETLLLSSLNSAESKDPEALDGRVREAIKLHVGRAEQSDDITIMALTYLPDTRSAEGVE